MENIIDLVRIKEAIAKYPDFPKEGILFEDLTPIFMNKELFPDFIFAFVHHARKLGEFDYVAGIEARGFILGSALAAELGVGFVPVRKKGKLPGKTISVTYSLEYGEDTLEIQDNPDLANSRVLLIDDVFATGGTLKATVSLFKQLGCKVAAGVAMDIGIADIKLIGVDSFVVL